MRRRLAPVAIAGALALLASLALAHSDPVRRADERSLDVRFSVRGPLDPGRLAVVAIDEKTFDELDPRWPMRRRRHARAIDRLRRAGARLIVYDVQFTEPSGSPADDLMLFDAVARARDVVLATSESDRRGRTRVLGGDAALAQVGAVAAAANFPTGAGGVIRRYERRVGRLAAIAPVAAARAGGAPRGDDFDARGRALIDFRGPAGTIPTYSFSDLLRGRVPNAALRGRVVVVGASHPTLQDLHPTPAGARMMPGPEIQANAIWTALHGNPLRELAGWAGWLLLLAGGLLGPAAVAALGPLRGTAVTVAAGALAAGGAQAAFEHGIVAPIAAPVLAVALGLAAAVLAAVAAETAERRRVAWRNRELEAAVQERTRDLEASYLELVERLARAAELRDDDTGDHIERVGRMCELVALELGRPEREARLLRHASTLHDVGKIGVPDGILLKPGRLTDAEMELMRHHTTHGAELLADSRSPLMQLAEIVARTHHEHWDGAGYPAGISGDAIPLAGRITAVCDVYDALVSERPYKDAWTPADALAEIERQSGRHFDPRVADALLRVVGHRTAADRVTPAAA